MLAGRSPDHSDSAVAAGAHAGKIDHDRIRATTDCGPDEIMAFLNGSFGGNPSHGDAPRSHADTYEQHLLSSTRIFIGPTR